MPRGKSPKKNDYSPPEATACPELNDIELFAGAGGMGVGLRAAGFGPCRFYEVDEACCETLSANLTSDNPTLQGFVLPGAAQLVNWKPLSGNVRLLAAGAPCQPFSIGGKHAAHNDGRNLFPELVRAVQELRPLAVIVENVRGLARSSFRPYFDYVLRQLKFPSCEIKKRETWRSHNARLKSIELSSRIAPEYSVDFRVVDAADFGVPQNRARIFIVATRSELPPYSFPTKTHSKDALIQALSGKEYWERHEIRRRRLNMPQIDMEVAQQTLPWVTVRDAISTLPEPSRNRNDAVGEHWLIPGARAYAKHTGSTMDWPSKTVKAGVHGVPGGENTITLDNRVFRYFSLREIARLQTFPDAHRFIGTRTKITRQIGNAVPCVLSAAIARPLAEIIQRFLSIPVGCDGRLDRAIKVNRNLRSEV